MYKKLISSVLVVALLNLVGCYSMSELTKEEVITDKEYDDLTVITKDSLKYKFEKPDFYIVNDTLKGIAGIIDQDTRIREHFDANIPLSDIIMFETSKYDGTKTLIVIGATVLVVVGIFFIVLAEGDWMSDPGLKF